MQYSMRLELLTNISQILRGRVLANISYLTAGSFFQIIFGFCSNILLVRFLEPEHFGTYAVIFAGLSLISSIISLRIPIHIIKAKEISGIDFQNTLHIGDHPINDIKGARDLGINTMWFNSQNLTWDIDNNPPIEFNHWSEFNNLLSLHHGQ